VRAGSESAKCRAVGAARGPSGARAWQRAGRAAQGRLGARAPRSVAQLERRAGRAVRGPSGALAERRAGREARGSRPDGAARWRRDALVEQRVGEAAR